jgi:hypothetical protein
MFLKDNLNVEFSGVFDDSLIRKYPLFRSDPNFILFIKELGGGYFFESSLHVFSFKESVIDYLTVEKVNVEIKKYYQNFESDKYAFFGQDAFGNLFYFNDEGIGFFEIETGEETFFG